MSEQRLIDIETKLAFQEDAVRQLHEVVCEQQKQIDRLEITCKILLDRLKELTLESGNNPTAYEKPPHY